MIKIVLIAGAIACAAAQGLGDYKHHKQAPSHGHAYSSQSFVLHQPHQEHHQQQHHQQQQNHQQQYQQHQQQQHHQPQQYHYQPQSHASAQPQGHQSSSQHYHHQPSAHQAHFQPQYHYVELKKPEPVQAHKEYHHEEQEYAYPKYSYAYEVKDPHTHDIKSQQETRDGDVVKGSYSFLEADGTTRIVEYTVDKKSGFNAVVKHEGHPTEQPKYHH